MPYVLSLHSDFGSEARVESISTQERLGQLFRYQVRLRSRSESLDLRKILGTSATVEYETDGGLKRYFNGIVIEAGQDGFQTLGGATDVVYWLTLAPKPWLASQKRDCRIYKNLSVPEIIKKVLGEFGYSDIRPSLSQSYAKRDYCVQYREDYLNFVCRLMEQEGIYFYFTHSSNTHTMVLTDSTSGHSPIPGGGSLSFMPVSDGAHLAEPGVTTFASAQSVHTTKYSLTDYDPLKPRTPLQVDEPLGDLGSAHTVSGLESFDYPGDYVEKVDGKRYAQVCEEALAVPLAEYSGTATAPELLMGGLFTLKNFAREELNQEYLVVAQSLQITNSADASSGGDDSSFACSFGVIPSKRPFRTLPTAPRPVISGLQTAVVCGSDTAEDIVVDKYGRVQVIFFWLQKDRTHYDISCPARVASFWAGKQWGAIHIPRVGQEVVVSFLEGDPDRPLIIGSVYNADNMPPYALPDNKTQSGVKSRSHEGGAANNYNEFRFEDKKGSEEILLHAEKDHREEVEHDHFVEIGNDETEHIKHDRKHTIDNDEVFTIKNDRTHDVTGFEKVTIGKDRTHTVKGSETIEVKQDSSVKIDGKQEVKIGTTYLLDAGQEITLKTGASSLVMKADGTITLKGVTINVEAAANMSIKANVNLAAEAGVQMSLKGDVMLSAEGGAMAQLKGTMTSVQGSAMTQVSGGVVMIG